MTVDSRGADTSLVLGHYYDRIRTDLLSVRIICLSDKLGVAAGDLVCQSRSTMQVAMEVQSKGGTHLDITINLAGT